MRRGPVSALAAAVAATTPSTITVDGVLTGTAAGLTIQNTTAATVGAQVQRSPAFWQYGRVWDTDDAVSRSVGMGWQMRPVAGATVSGALHLMQDLAGSVTDAGVSIGASFVALGATPAETGNVRLPATGTIYAKRSGVLSDRALVAVVDDYEWRLGPQANLGATGGDPTLYFQGGGISMFLNTSAMYSLGATRLDIQSPSEIRFSNGAPDTCLVYRQTKTSGNGATMIFRGGGASAASANGGATYVDTGRHGAGGTPGVGQLRGNRDDVTLDTCLSWDTSGSAGRLGFYGAAPAVKPTISGAILAEAVLGDLCAALATLGLIADSTTGP